METHVDNKTKHTKFTNSHEYCFYHLLL